MTDNSITSQTWDQQVTLRKKHSQMGWLDSPFVLNEYVHPKIGCTGNWLVDEAIRLDVPKDSRWIAIGCGGAEVEVFASQSGLFSSMDAVDLSPDSIRVAKEHAQGAGVSNINFYVHDFNNFKAEEKYDVAVMSMALHHVANLEDLLQSIKNCLSPGGLFMVNEYIGPTQIQYTPIQLRVANKLLRALPEKYRVMYANDNVVKQGVFSRTRDEWNKADPSEAIRSDEIVPLLNQYFNVIKHADYGGTILDPVLSLIIGNFAAGTEEDNALLKMLFAVEDVLISEGVIQSDFAVIVSQN